jgi:hypothetical protein
VGVELGGVDGFGGEHRGAQPLGREEAEGLDSTGGGAVVDLGQHEGRAL